MKKWPVFSSLVVVLILVFVTSVVTSCIQPGPDGKPGLDGTDGKDGAESCGLCHNLSEDLLSRILQYENSVHASGMNIDRNGENCAWCHTSMGFRNYLYTGEKSAIDNPTPVNCRTCHPVHESYSLDDFDLRTKVEVAMLTGGGIYDYGNSNICANCHQARPVQPYPVSGGADITIHNPYYGPHYGPQSNMIIGSGPFEIAGSQPYISSMHKNAVKEGCVSCHLSPGTANLAGGHQMGIKYTTQYGSTGYHFTGCYTCHTNLTLMNSWLEANRTEIQALIEELKGLLLDQGLLNASGLVPVPKTMTQVQLAALLNYKFVVGDKSDGAHNYLYTKALLINAIEALE